MDWRRPGRGEGEGEGEKGEGELDPSGKSWGGEGGLETDGGDGGAPLPAEQVPFLYIKMGELFAL